jgi:hypothetical protein
VNRFTVIGLYLEPLQSFAHQVEAATDGDALLIVERDFLSDCGDFFIVGVAPGDVTITLGLDEGGGRS